MGLLFSWWAWGIAAAGLVVLEILVPVFVLLGFGIGAAGMALLLAIFGPGMFFGSASFAILVFALLSLAAWLALRHFFKLRKGQVKVFEDDINAP